jgi:hypothetical protein
VSYIDELREIIHKLHGATATHVESVPVTEVFEGRTIWDGIVEVFDLKGHPGTHRVYARSHETDDPDSPKRHVYGTAYSPRSVPNNSRESRHNAGVQRCRNSLNRSL